MLALEPSCSFPGDVDPVAPGQEHWAEPCSSECPHPPGLSRLLSPDPLPRERLTGNGGSPAVNLVLPISEMLMAVRCRSHLD